MTTRLTRTAVAGMCLSFIVIGALQAAYGPAVPAMRARFGISDAEVGLALSAHFVGALLGVLGTPALRRRVSNRVFLALALATMIAGSLLFAGAPAWPVALAAAMLGGVGFGWIDVGVNEMFLEAYGNESTGMLNALHATFGIGAVLAPLLVGALPDGWYPVAFIACAALSAVALGTVSGVRGRREPGPVPGAARRATAWRLTVVFGVFFALHVGVESGVGGWETAHLVALGWTASAAAAATSTFWLAMTAVRFAVHPLARRFSAEQILFGSIVTMLLGVALAFVAPLAPVGYALAGVGVGPLFPTGLVWLSQKVPGVTSYVIAASMLGGVFPSVLGGAVELWGMTAVPGSLTVLSILCLACALAIRGRHHRPRYPARAGTTADA
ncbi:MFS transporter [Actinophytocola sp.]|jgi:fucose permease|uniref:MFS transporter n=1 Tax=Actinophytocola sp. TaxID=1872138 RepID=UPI002EDB8554